MSNGNNLNKLWEFTTLKINELLFHMKPKLTQEQYDKLFTASLEFQLAMGDSLNLMSAGILVGTEPIPQPEDPDT